MAGVVHIPWYATVFRGDRFEVALEEIAPLALRYGATEYAIYRSRDDAYKFLQLATFENKSDFDRYWNGEEFSLWRGDYTSFYTGARALPVERPGGARRGRLARDRQPCSRGAIVSPASFKSSQ